jgi:hypothetical protein
MNSISDMSPVNKNFFCRKALPAKFDYEKVSVYFSYHLHDVIKHTLKKAQLADSTIHYTMRLHLKSRFQILSYKRLNEVMPKDIYFYNEN